MRLLNLKYDDLMLLSQLETRQSHTGRKGSFLNVPMGKPIMSGIRPNLLIGGNLNYEIDETIVTRSDLDLNVDFGDPALMVNPSEKRQKDGKNILITGTFTKDVSALTSKLELAMSNMKAMSKVRVLAGGYMPMEDGTPWVNLALIVPATIAYKVGDSFFSCDTDRPSNRKYPNTLDLVSVVRYALIQ